MYLLETENIQALPADFVATHQVLSVAPDFALTPLIHRWNHAGEQIYNKSALKIISHEIENGCRVNQFPPRLFAGFQYFSRFLPQQDRYRELLAVTSHIFVFGVPDIPTPDVSGITFIPISPEHRLATEWFIVVDGREFYCALVAEAMPESSVPNQYRGLWSFDETLVHTLQQQLSLELGILPYTSLAIGPRQHRTQLATLNQTANRLVNALDQQNRLLHQQQQLREDLQHMLIHDLRGALTGVIGSLQLLNSGKVEPGDDQAMLLQNSLDNARRLSTMISNVLDLDKMEAGELHLNRQPVHLPSLVDLTLSRWQASLRWEQKTITTKHKRDFPVILADVDLIERILDNLLTNALKYGSEIQVNTVFKSGWVILQVQDNGPGIPAHDRQRIFEKFKQANHGSLQRRGTGLGLAFVKLAVEAHSGMIEVSDAPEGGAVFSVFLPLRTPTLPARLKGPDQVISIPAL